LTDSVETRQDGLPPHSEIVDRLRASQFGHLAEPLSHLLEPSIRLAVWPVPPDDLPLGASRFGGLPDLPAVLHWPACEGRALAHIAQLNLSEVAPLDHRDLLPSRGWLYFFFDTADETPFAEHRGGPSWRVLHFDGTLGGLCRSEPPAAIRPPAVYRSCRLGMTAEWTLPSYGSTLLADLPLEDQQRTVYEDLVFSLHSGPPVPNGKKCRPWHKFLGRMQHLLLGDPIHRILGHPEHFQSDPRLDWQRLREHRPVAEKPDAATIQQARQWLLLLQVDTYRHGPGWKWGDNSTAYFGILKDELAAGNFDTVQWTVECA